MNAFASVMTKSESAFPMPPTLLPILYRAAALLKHNPDAAMKCIEEASELLADPQETDGGPVLRRLACWQARKVTSYIEENLHLPIRVSALAAMAGQSVSHFSAAFKGSFGKSPHANILERRIERAKHILRDGNESLCNIALECGLADQSHFSRVFRQHAGMPPGAWRRRQQDFYSTTMDEGTE